MSTMLDTVAKIHPDIITSFLSNGECNGLPVDVQQFLSQLQWAAEIYEYERNISRAAKTLQVRAKAIQGLQLSLRTCKSRIYAAIDYFSVDNNVASRVWEEDFANKYEDLGKLAVASNDIKTAKACYDASRDCRARAAEHANAEEAHAPIFIISTEISLDELGFAKKSLKAIAKKNNDGYYINIIENLPIEKEDKKRLLRDANIAIEDATLLEEVNDE